MVKYIVQGGQRLEGAVSISGAKNAAVAILPATLLVDGVCRIENVPDISDVRLLLEILNNMGAKIRRLSRNTLEIDCSHVRNATAPIELVRRIRASYYLIGAELGRFGHVLCQTEQDHRKLRARDRRLRTDRAVWIAREISGMERSGGPRRNGGQQEQK